MTQETHDRFQEVLKSFNDPESRKNKYSIDIDCPPMSPRPDSYLLGVLKDTGIEVDDFEEPSRVFGNWCWILKASANKDELYTKNKPIYKERLSKLYNAGLIRYASW
jgi:hypothetical protein